MSKIRAKIEKYRKCYCKPQPEYEDDPSIKLFKKEIDHNFNIPVGYNGLAVGLTIAPSSTVTVSSNSKLVVL